jgi:hypothetical protein
MYHPGIYFVWWGSRYLILVSLLIRLRIQLLMIASGLTYLHSLKVVHGDINMVGDCYHAMWLSYDVIRRTFYSPRTGVPS